MTSTSRTLGRRSFLGLAAAALPFATALRASAQSASKPQITVYKSSSCGCCGDWVTHMEGAGFAVTVKETDDTDKIAKDLGVPTAGLSCHVGVVSGYIVEGHVPADAVQKVLREKPAILGLTVPGMPMSAPGMYRPGGPKEPYTIMAIDKAGKMSVYQKREGGA